MWPSDYHTIYCEPCCVVVEKAPGFRGGSNVFCPNCLASCSLSTAEAECSAAALFYTNPKNAGRRGVFRFLPASKAVPFAARTDMPVVVRLKREPFLVAEAK